MPWRFEHLSILWTKFGLPSSIGLTFDEWPDGCMSTSEQKKKQSGCSSDTKIQPRSPRDCPIEPGNVMIWSMLLLRSSSMPAIFCCFLALVIWSVAVMGLHHMRESHPINAEEGIEAASKIWQPEETGLQDPIPLFRLDLSTEDNYKSTTEDEEDNFCGSKFASIRRGLDYTFHKHYKCERLMFQDSIVESLLHPASEGSESENQEEACPATLGRHWAIFTAGAMGAGKSYTIKKLEEKGRFPLSQFVVVDPDSIRRQLPEFERYVEIAPERAGELTRKEAGKVAEILTQAALERGQNVLIDGTLRNSTWYIDHFQELRQRYPKLKLGILHITAPREAILERAMVS